MRPGKLRHLMLRRRLDGGKRSRPPTHLQHPAGVDSVLLGVTRHHPIDDPDHILGHLGTDALDRPWLTCLVPEQLLSDRSHIKGVFLSRRK